MHDEKGVRAAMIALATVALLAVAAFMMLNLRGNLAFALELRGIRLLGLCQVAVAIAVSTVLFQMVTQNRILTPSIMGMDALYLFGQMALVLALGGLGFAVLDDRLKFAIEVGAMMALSLALFLPLLGARMDMTLLLLAGVVLGLLFRSLTSLVARLIDPNDFAVAQDASFASFSDMPGDLLAIGLVLTFGAAILAWRQRHALDVLALGADAATGLGIDVRRMRVALLVLVAVLVSVSTALVGPVAFLGLLVVALAERLAGTRRHAVLMPAAALTAIIVLVGGQAVLEHGLGGAATLGVVVEFLGGIVFLVLLFAETRR